MQFGQLSDYYVRSADSLVRAAVDDIQVRINNATSFQILSPIGAFAPLFPF
jgi:hypothetical protein